MEFLSIFAARTAFHYHQPCAADPTDVEGFQKHGRSLNLGRHLPETAEWGMIFPLSLLHPDCMRQQQQLHFSPAPITLCPALLISAQAAAPPEAVTRDVAIRRKIFLSVKAAWGGEGERGVPSARESD